MERIYRGGHVSALPVLHDDLYLARATLDHINQIHVLATYLVYQSQITLSIVFALA